MEEKTSEQPFRAGYVAIIGAPNVGKSTLMNDFLQQKISIVTPKPQTTRNRILGIRSGENFQIIFLDTPGLLEPAYLLQESMMKSARSAIDDADIILFMVEATNVKPSLNGDRNISLLETLQKPVYLVINKIDLVKKASLLPAMDLYSKLYRFDEIFPVSALTLDGVRELKDFLIQALPQHPAFYPADMVSDQSERFFVAEIIREKIFEGFRQEIPYSATVEIVEFKEREGEKDFISAEIYVERSSQKSILIGRGGQALKEVGQLSRKDIEKFLNRPVYLELHVKVREGWRDNKSWLKRFGYS